MLMWFAAASAFASPVVPGIATVHTAPEGGGGPSQPTGQAPPDITYTMSDTVVDPHWKGIHLPIVLRNPKLLPVCDPDDLQLSVRFDATLFFFRSLTQGTVVNQSLSGNTMTLDISMAGTPQIANGVITELVGDVLLGDEQSTNFYISTTCAGVPSTLDSGNMYESPGFCEEGAGEDGRGHADRLLKYRDGFRIKKIAPNPSRGGEIVVDVSTLETEETFLELFDAAGGRVYAVSWTPISMQQEDLARDIKLPADLPSGTYTMVLRSPARRAAETLIISR